MQNPFIRPCRARRGEYLCTYAEGHQERAGVPHRFACYAPRRYVGIDYIGIGVAIFMALLLLAHGVAYFVK